MIGEMDDLLKKVKPFLQENGVNKFALFGSRARGEQKPTSDFDFLVEFEKGRTLLDLVNLKQELEILTSSEVDLVTYRSLLPSLRERVLLEQIILYG